MKALSLIALSLAAVLAAPPSSAARATLPIYDAEQLTQACDTGLAQAKSLVKRIESVPLAKARVGTVLHQWNRLYIALENLEGPVYILNSVSPEEKVRDAGDKCLIKINVFSTELYQNEKLFERIRAVKARHPVDQKLRQDLLEAFEDTGVALVGEKRARMKDILQRLEKLRLEFEKNIRDNKSKVSFTSEDMKGLPADYLARAKRDEQGNYLLGFNYPEYEPFMENAENGEARRRYQFAFVNRGTAKNMELLTETIKLRQEIAALYGMESFADFVIRRRMAEKPQAVLKFLEQVKAAVEAKERQEIQELTALKAERSGKQLAETKLERWDVGYFQAQIKKARFSIDEEALRKNFPVEATLQWVLEVSQNLYGIRFERAEVPVWHPELRYYDVKDAKSGKFLGGAYLDLFPREGKYGHAAVFPVRAVSTLAGRRPISVLVTNFNRQGLKYSEVETFWHEFGHLLHGVLSDTRYAPHAGTSVERDFVEAPSQMFEEWARRKESTAVLAKVCATCPPLDDDLLKRLGEARRYGKGILYARQHLYAGYDMALSSARPSEPQALWEKMEGATALGYIPGTQFAGSFGHLMSGYAAGYYGYMWSEVIGLDMLSPYGKNIMDAQIGQRYRQTILARGSERKGMQMVRQFLGREPSPEAFFAEITGRRH
ncbi:MAG: Zn-dependent oligopeptidase [Betaproteobacteria bacterium]|nr:Zn-dependent oligopeptidase [Betaproteobacteria bacterium]